MEDAFESYNNKNTDSIKYYSEDAVSFSNGKMPLEGKKAIHESMKSELLTFPKGSKSHSKRKKYMLQTMEIW
jgi:ketosteroid isomerase-like protein